VPGTVRSVTAEDIILMQRQTQFLWSTYFSSIENIVTTTLEVIETDFLVVHTELYRVQLKIV